mmetsp:Transcript_24547/g.35992  ORF Transcript_24547/g.35992 Transcript_24547/m.35992 type:complete len:452 (-) Transcript_24547:474-1829(-)|eukprot:CAMPEP_0195518952 /NCGR_PEP_ID=MMETSP0794_2-20130614/14019_1 /TAXON_ID=515487 /ORGANISM="Stephanopyxis turris, Strain CCMP 815" /LENGTH=451 /DNA_ID=CAMNT_0040648009 /DNA_START=134 /DNA_END=1489 /DNA_ORIENTATION=+
MTTAMIAVLKRAASTATNAATIAAKSSSSLASSSAAPSLLSKIKSVPIKYPLGFGVAVSTVKTSVSDLLVQKAIERKEQVDWKRNFAFASFGFVYLGVVQYTIYVNLFGRLFPGAAAFAAKSLRGKLKDAKGMRDLGSQVFLDQFVHHPLMYFPAFYCIKELVTSSDSSEGPDFKRVLMEYKDNMKEDLVALWKIWVPTTVLNFAFMPMWARIPWVAGTSFVWTCILSAMRGGDLAHTDDMVGGQLTGATLELVKERVEGYLTNPVDIDPTLSHITLSAVGPHRVGVVAGIAKKVAESGGNVTHSNMVRMGKEFIILMHISTEPENRLNLTKALKETQELNAYNVHVSSLNRQETRHRYKALEMSITCVGVDKPGMLAAITQDFADRGVAIESITTELRLCRTGTRKFFIKAEYVGKRKMEKGELDAMIADLSEIKSHLGLDILDIRVRLP